MKDISLFLLKNALGAKMRKSFKNFCHGDASTSTLNQQKPDHSNTNHSPSSGAAAKQSSLEDDHCYLNDNDRQPTLEEMILQLELEERIARRRAKVGDEYGEIKHRMSCVNSSDILRTARNALNQYPRFSLDGKDSMYRSSFRNLQPPSSAGITITDSRKSSCCSNDLNFSDVMAQNRRNGHLPAKLGGERVVWCKPGVVAKLMGLDAMPVPCNNKEYHHQRRNLRKRAAERHEIERRVAVMNAARRSGKMMMMMRGSCSSSRPTCEEQWVMKHGTNEDAGWPMRHFF